MEAPGQLYELLRCFTFNLPTNDTNMDENLLIERREVGDYRISVYYDIDSECPCTNWDMGGRYLFEFLNYGRYSLCSKCNWKDWFYEERGHTMDEAIEKMVVENVEQKHIVNFIKAGKVNGLRLAYNRSSRLWELQKYSRYSESHWSVDREFEPYELKEGDVEYELIESWEREELLELLSEYSKDIVVTEFSSSGYSQGDSMLGVAYMTKERFDKMCGFDPKRYKTWQEQAMDVMEAEIKCIELWAWGDVKGFVLEKRVPYTKIYDNGRPAEEAEDWEEVDSCWGFFLEEAEDVIKEVMSEYDIKETA